MSRPSYTPCPYCQGSGFMLTDELARREQEARARRFWRQFWVTLVVSAVIIAVAYAIFHTVRYQNCLVKPGLFQWPNECV